MHSHKLLSALVALSGLAAASCPKNIKITTLNPTIDCDVVEGDITVDENLSGDLVINGPKQIKGDLTINNATKLISVSSTSINAIGGKFELIGLTFLSNVNMPSLRSINDLTLQTLRGLDTLTFGSSGVTKASKVTIVDTIISDLSGLNLATVDSFTITDNNRLTMFNSDLVNITDQLTIGHNGNSMQVNMAQLEMASDISVSNVKSFSVPALKSISALRFDTNPELESFSAKNLTQVGANAKNPGSLSFINNNKLENVTFSKLAKINGDLTILNNTALTEVSGFPKLTSIYGALLLGGDFKSIDLPKVNVIQGGATITSTKDIKSFCSDDFDKLGAEGTTKCTYKNADANSAKQGDAGGGDDETDSSSSSDDDKNSASGVMLSMSTMAVGLLVAASQLL